MYAGSDELIGLFDKAPQSRPAALVSRRNDLHDGHNAVIAGMSHRNYIGFCGVFIDLCPCMEVSSGR